MARISTRELYRFRSLLPSTKPYNFSSLSSSASSSVYSGDGTISLFKACQNIKHLFQIQAHLITSGLFFKNPFWTIRVLKRSSDFGNIDYTIWVFKCIDNPDTFCVNAVIKAYSNSIFPDQAVSFYFNMIKNGFLPNSYSFVPLLGSCSKIDCIEGGKMCHGLAVKNGVDFVLQVRNCLIHMYGCFGVIDYAAKVFTEMSERDLISWNSMVDGCVRAGNLQAAHQLFDVMTERNVVSWNIMINGYLKSGNPGCSLKLFREMVKTGFQGSYTTMVSVLTACGKSARLKEGSSVHGFIIRTSEKSNVILNTSLIDMYSKCGKVELAQRVFYNMEIRNLVCWNAMILGHCIHGKPEAGLKLFTDLVDQTRADGKSISPDEITFIGVLCACARAKLLTEGIGFIEKAEELLGKMPEDMELPSESLVWVNILSSCRFQGDVALGERIAKSLIDMDPHDFSYYRLLLNVYDVAGRREDVAMVKEQIKERKFGKMPGCGLVDLKEIVHELKL
ncbi:pentatricopeptide repeat-containing protein At3g51320 isoform X2 [Mangifera indica]|uniref:pentatricopeptide repeat-containing protein At3g51320 isoform X2 n=1 Tax=Mangifera indica TaxID=29780 RepID=UPI001CFB47FB|nr:pentatricopeptide repeat-containing protein At3g51320 isoform X2 [Mangifera indica]